MLSWLTSSLCHPGHSKATLGSGDHSRIRLARPWAYRAALDVLRSGCLLRVVAQCFGTSHFSCCFPEELERAPPFILLVTQFFLEYKSKLLLDFFR
jgi:hypothetical protein